MDWRMVGRLCMTARPRTRTSFTPVVIRCWQWWREGGPGGWISILGMGGQGGRGRGQDSNLKLEPAQASTSLVLSRSGRLPPHLSPSPHRPPVLSFLAMSDAYIVHRIIRRIAGWAVVSFFTEIHVVGGENVPKNAPIIVYVPSLPLVLLITPLCPYSYNPLHHAH